MAPPNKKGINKKDKQSAAPTPRPASPPPPPPAPAPVPLPPQVPVTPADIPIPFSPFNEDAPNIIPDDFDNMPPPPFLTNPIIPASATASRTTTPGTAAYETATGYETPTGQRTPSPPSTKLPPAIAPAQVRRTLTIDWPLELPFDHKGDLRQFTQTFRAPSQSNEPTTIICSNESSPAGTLLISLELGYPASVELRVFNEVVPKAPVVTLFVDAGDPSEFLLTQKAIKTVAPSAGQARLLFSLLITAAPEPATPSAASSPYPTPTPIISETCSPAAIESLAHFLDQAGGHDVVFCFPDNKQLYADRFVLQRSSRYFRALFHLRSSEGVPVSGPRSAAAMRLADDSDAEGGDSDKESSPMSKRSRSSPTGSERDITLQGSVDTPMTSVAGDQMDPATVPLPGDAKYTFQRTASPLMDDNVFVMNINETSFNTFRAFLYYIYTGFISFAPLTSSFQFAPGTVQSASMLDQRRLEARNQLVSDYVRTHPNRPLPVSPKSIYAVALKYELPALEAQALSRINSAIVNPFVAVTEVFSAFSRVHASVRKPQLEKVIASWEDVVKSQDWELASKKGKSQPDAYFATILCEILESLPNRSSRLAL